MEEKVSALEGLGAIKGFSFFKRCYAKSCSAQTKDCVTHTQSNSFQIKRNNVIEAHEKGISFMIDQDTKGKDDEASKKGSENSVMNTDCDITIFKSKEKTEKSDNFKDKEVSSTGPSTIIKENSFDEIFEEVESVKNEEASHDINSKKIPSAVQEWINHLPSKVSISSKENLDSKEPKEGLGLSTVEGSPLMRAQLSREASLQSSSSLDSILDSRRPDPVEIFLNLGFGGLPGVDTDNCRIPKRFLVPSKCKGGDWNEFLKRELIQAQNFECSSLGFRGLSGPSYRRPSAIVANIMEKLRERAVPQPHNKSRFSTVAKMVLNEKSVLNKLSPEFQSVLSPDSRKFLQNQGKKSPEVPRRRIIFGQKSFAFAHDGEFVEVESSSAEHDRKKDSPLSLSISDAIEEPPAFPNSDVLLKLRRSSLQKQKKVEEDTDVDDVFYVLESAEHSSEPLFGSNDCSKKTDKIPRRFFSSTNLKALEENLSETMRLEVEKEIMSLSQKIKNISNQELPSVLQQVKELRSKIENSGQESSEM